MNKDFWQDQLKLHEKLCFLAPMDGYGDSAYRQSMKRIAPHIYCISEFYSADGLVHSKFLADSVLPHQEVEKPLIIQIFGKNVENFEKSAKIIEKYGVAGIDVNMGCPAKKVVKSGHGSSLIINEEVAFDIVRALDQSTNLPISVKTRRSFDGNQDLIKFAQGLQKAGAKLITIHGRTTKQAYTGLADFTDIYELQKNLDIPVICNGDILNYDDGMSKVRDLAGFMIGRKSFGNPWCFLPSPTASTPSILNSFSFGGERDCNSHYSNPQNFLNGCYQPTLGEMLEAMEFHASELVKTKGERKGSLEIRKHLVQYIKSFPGVKEYRKRLVTTESIEMTRETIDEMKVRFGADLEKRPGFGEVE